MVKFDERHNQGGEYCCPPIFRTKGMLQDLKNEAWAMGTPMSCATEWEFEGEGKFPLKGW